MTQETIIKFLEIRTKILDLIQTTQIKLKNPIGKEIEVFTLYTEETLQNLNQILQKNPDACANEKLEYFDDNIEIAEKIKDIKQLINALQLFLETQWQLIQGSCLSYTAAPEHPITQLMCDLAIQITDYRNLENPQHLENTAENAANGPTSALKILMPTLTRSEAATENYPCLFPVFIWEYARYTHNVIETDAITDETIKSLDKNTFNLVKLRKLQQVIVLVKHNEDAYEQLNLTDKIGEKNSDLYREVHGNVHFDKQLIQLIAENCQKRQLGFDENEYLVDLNLSKWHGLNVDIKQIIKQSIISDDGKSVLPMQIITQQMPQQIDNEKLEFFNPYNLNAPITANEIERLFNHSNTSKNILGTQQELVKQIKQSNSLYGYLMHFLQKLKESSVKYGKGTEDEADTIAYLFAIELNYFYQKLPEETKNTIPNETNDIIKDYLKKCGKNEKEEKEREEARERGEEARYTAPFFTNICTTILADELQKTIRKNEDKLIKISINTNHSMVNNIRDTRNKLLQQLKILTHNITNNAYSGNRSELITATIIKHYNLQINIENLPQYEYIFLKQWLKNPVNCETVTYKIMGMENSYYFSEYSAKTNIINFLNNISSQLRELILYSCLPTINMFIGTECTIKLIKDIKEQHSQLNHNLILMRFITSLSINQILEIERSFLYSISYFLSQILDNIKQQQPYSLEFILKLSLIIKEEKRETYIKLVNYAVTNPNISLLKFQNLIEDYNQIFTNTEFISPQNKTDFFSKLNIKIENLSFFNQLNVEQLIFLIKNMPEITQAVFLKNLNTDIQKNPRKFNQYKIFIDLKLNTINQLLESLAPNNQELFKQIILQLCSNSESNAGICIPEILENYEKFLETFTWQELKTLTSTKIIEHINTICQLQVYFALYPNNELNIFSKELFTTIATNSKHDINTIEKDLEYFESLNIDAKYILTYLKSVINPFNPENIQAIYTTAKADKLKCTAKAIMLLLQNAINHAFKINKHAEETIDDYSKIITVISQLEEHDKQEVYAAIKQDEIIKQIQTTAQLQTYFTIYPNSKLNIISKELFTKIAANSKHDINTIEKDLEYFESLNIDAKYILTYLKSVINPFNPENIQAIYTTAKADKLKSTAKAIMLLLQTAINHAFKPNKHAEEAIDDEAEIITSENSKKIVTVISQLEEHDKEVYAAIKQNEIIKQIQTTAQLQTYFTICPNNELNIISKELFTTIATNSKHDINTIEKDLEYFNSLNIDASYILIYLKSVINPFNPENIQAIYTTAKADKLKCTEKAIMLLLQTAINDAFKLNMHAEETIDDEAEIITVISQLEEQYKQEVYAAIKQNKITEQIQTTAQLQTYFILYPKSESNIISKELFTIIATNSKHDKNTIEKDLEYFETLNIDAGYILIYLKSVINPFNPENIQAIYTTAKANKLNHTQQAIMLLLQIAISNAFKPNKHAEEAIDDEAEIITVISQLEEQHKQEFYAKIKQQILNGIAKGETESIINTLRTFNLSIDDIDLKQDIYNAIKQQIIKLNQQAYFIETQRWLNLLTIEEQEQFYDIIKDEIISTNILNNDAIPVNTLQFYNAIPENKKADFFGIIMHAHGVNQLQFINSKIITSKPEYNINELMQDNMPPARWILMFLKKIAPNFPHNKNKLHKTNHTRTILNAFFNKIKQEKPEQLLSIIVQLYIASFTARGNYAKIVLELITKYIKSADNLNQLIDLTGNDYTPFQRFMLVRNLIMNYGHAQEAAANLYSYMVIGLNKQQGFLFTTLNTINETESTTEDNPKALIIQQIQQDLDALQQRESTTISSAILPMQHELNQSWQKQFITTYRNRETRFAQHRFFCPFWSARWQTNASIENIQQYAERHGNSRTAKIINTMEYQPIATKKAH